MTEPREPKPFYEKLYKVNVLPDGNLNSVNVVDEVLLRMQDTADSAASHEKQNEQHEENEEKGSF